MLYVEEDISAYITEALNLFQLLADAHGLFARDFEDSVEVTT